MYIYLIPVWLPFYILYFIFIWAISFNAWLGYFLIVGYVVWYIYDFKTPEQGGRSRKYWSEIFVIYLYCPEKLLSSQISGKEIQNI